MRTTCLLYQDQICLQKQTCLPKNCIFRNQNHQNLEHGIIFWNTSANVSPYLWNNSCYQILLENHRAILHCAPPLLILRRLERCLPITLDYLPVHSFNNSTANFRDRASVTFLIYSDERPLLTACFLKHFEMCFSLEMVGRSAINTQTCFLSQAKHFCK